MIKEIFRITKTKLAIAVLAILYFTVPVSAEPIVMGYWENWGTYQNFPMPDNAAGSSNAVLSSQITGLTALAYAFLEVAPDGTLMFTDIWSDLSPNSPQDRQFCNASPTSCGAYPQNAGLGNFSAFAKTQVAHHVVSVGGANHDETWEYAFAHPDKFVSSLKALVDAYKIDSLDIDYEPLGGVPPQHITGFIELTNKIKQTLPALNLFYAIPANSQSVKNFGQANWQKLAKNLNYISIMGYDMHGAFDITRPQTALHSSLIAEDSDYSVESTLHALNAAGIANQKIILGMPMYGRAVGGVSTSGLNQIFTESVQGDLDNSCSTNLQATNVCSGMIQYKTLVDQNHTAIPVAVNDKLAGVYAYDANKKMFISYDNANSAAAKAQYAIDNHLAGVMFWALRFDKPVNHPHSILGAVDKVYGIKPKVATDDVKMQLGLTNNDPNNPVTITLVTADKSKYYAFPQLAAKGQQGSDVMYNDINSSSVKALMNSNNVLVLLTPARGEQLWCRGSLNFTSGANHRIHVYFDTPVPNCAIN